MQVDVNRVMSLLPHRYPFLLLDRILEVEPGVRAIGIKNVTINEEFFNGHFPGRPMMPGVLVLEAMAQVGGVMLLTAPGNAGKLAVFGGMDRVRFRKPIIPGDQLVSEVRMLKLHSDFGKVKAVGRVEGEVVAEAEYTFVLLADHTSVADAEVARSAGG